MEKIFSQLQKKVDKMSFAKISRLLSILKSPPEQAFLVGVNGFSASRRL